MIEKSTVSFGEAVHLGMERILKVDVLDPERFFAAPEALVSAAPITRLKAVPNWFSGSTSDQAAAAFDPGV